MATVEDRIKKVTSKVLGVDPNEIKPQHHFAADLGAGHPSTGQRPPGEPGRPPGRALQFAAPLRALHCRACRYERSS